MKTELTQIKYNVWGEGFAGSATADYCDNPQYDFIYSAYFAYRNNTCKKYSSGEAVQKLFAGTGGLFIMTFEQVTITNTTDSSSKTTNYFAPGAEGTTLKFDLSYKTSLGLEGKNPLCVIKNPIDGDSVSEHILSTPC